MATRERHAPQEERSEGDERIAQLAAHAFLRATFAYGGELRLHFGEPVPYEAPAMSGKTHGKWVLSLRSTPWVLAIEGIVVARSHDEQQHALRQFAQMEGTRLAEARLRRSDASLTLRFDNGGWFTALTEPRPRAKSSWALWELLMPDGLVLVARKDRSIAVEHQPDRIEREADMSKNDVHTVPHGDGWANRREGATRVSNTAPTKAEAQATGRKMAQKAKVEHHIHKKDGTVGERNSYGHDPRRSKG